ncbi:MAG: DUF309 domain-containing protein [Pseudomonadota bacterium]
MNAKDLPLPGHIYVPGKTARHDEAFLDPVKALAAQVTTDDTALENIAWLFGLRLIDEGYFWEAHEILETVWMQARPNSREKHLVQGVIHLANAGLKEKMERPVAAERLRHLALACFNEAYLSARDENLMGLALSDLQQTAKTGVFSRFWPH